MQTIVFSHGVSGYFQRRPHLLCKKYKPMNTKRNTSAHTYYFIRGNFYQPAGLAKYMYLCFQR